MSTFSPALVVPADRFFVTADSHYSHARICRATSDWPAGKETRDFASLSEMNAALVDGINAVVPEDGVLFHLGDWSFGGRDQIAAFREQLNVRTVHLVLGNHDHHLKKDASLHSLFASVNPYLEVRVGKQDIVLFHYSMRVWNASHKGSWCLYGHSHGSLPAWGRSLDVGVDGHAYRPYTFAEIAERMVIAQIELPDHHQNK